LNNAFGISFIFTAVEGSHSDHDLDIAPSSASAGWSHDECWFKETVNGNGMCSCHREGGRLERLEKGVSSISRAGGVVAVAIKTAFDE